MKDKKEIRDFIRTCLSVAMSFLYIPHLIFYIIDRYRGGVIKEDVQANSIFLKIRLPNLLLFLCLIHTNAYFRSLFYYRIGPIKTFIIGWWRPGNKYFQLSQDMTMEGGCLVVHPFSTILNAKSIGRNFTCRNCTTLGYGKGGRPILGNNVNLGVSVTIIGGIRIGDNVTVGAGSVVVKDVPDNCVVAGNPAKVIRLINDQ